jgi:hypothetical protein
LQQALDRWGVSWVFTKTDEARDLFAETTGEPGLPVGKYHAFRTASSSSRFLVGSGRLAANINRLELTDVQADNGMVVLKYRYHPAWKTDSGEAVVRHSIPEDPSGFLAIENPGREVTLRFDPAAIFGAAWPDDTSHPTDERTE